MSVIVKVELRSGVSGETTIVRRQILELAVLSVIARYHIKYIEEQDIISIQG